MTTIEQLWQAKKDAVKPGRAASTAHEAAEQHGSGSSYDAEFKAPAEARIRLQQDEGSWPFKICSQATRADAQDTTFDLMSGRCAQSSA